MDGDVLAGGLACLAATTCYGAGFACTRRFFSGGAHRASALSAVQITCATVQLGLVAPVLSGAPVWPGAGAFLALLVLGAAGTGYAYVLKDTLIASELPAHFNRSRTVRLTIADQVGEDGSRTGRDGWM